MALVLVPVDDDIHRHQMLVTRHLAVAAFSATFIILLLVIIKKLSRSFSASVPTSSYLIVETRPPGYFATWTREWDLISTRILDALDEYSYQL